VIHTGATQPWKAPHRDRRLPEAAGGRRQRGWHLGVAEHMVDDLFGRDAAVRGRCTQRAFGDVGDGFFVEVLAAPRRLRS
jgi:hypothetical protein